MRHHKGMKYFPLIPLLLVSTLPGVAQTTPPSDANKRLEASKDMLSEIMDVAEKAVPQTLLDRAQCVVLVPGLKKGAFIVGAKYGRGFVSCRGEQGVGWSAPGSIRVEGGSFGFQIGGSETDVLMLVMNEVGMKRLLRNKTTIGVDASAAAGPVGRTAQADTDIYLRAEMLTWSRARGLFAGVSLQGASLRPDQAANAELYGSKEVANADVLAGKQPVPAGAQPLIDALNKYSSRKTK
jgi:SH3 domain-containing YSC84-like protein 1